MIPQLGMELGYQVNCNLRAFFGYNVLWWSNVARAAEQIDTSVNTNLLPPVETTAGDSRPAFDFARSDFWAQGLNCGLEWAVVMTAAGGTGVSPVL